MHHFSLEEAEVWKRWKRETIDERRAALSSTMRVMDPYFRLDEMLSESSLCWMKILKLDFLY